VIREEPADPVEAEPWEPCRAGDRFVVAARQDTRDGILEVRVPMSELHEEAVKEVPISHG
jgi:hypothetical protein